MLPLGGLLIAVFVGWVLARRTVVDQLGFGDGKKWSLWETGIGFVAPAGIVIVFIYTIYESFG